MFYSYLCAPHKIIKYISNYKNTVFPIEPHYHAENKKPLIGKHIIEWRVYVREFQSHPHYI